jgi:dienelactone hydrolase
MPLKVLLLACAGIAAGASAVAAAERVDIPAGHETLHAVVYRPAGPGPFPAIVALHACGGLVDRSGQIAQRYGEWGTALAAAGFAVIFPDSFASRGLGSQCRVRERRVRASRERIGDANAARRWLQAQSWAAGNRISLVGWASGGVTALWAVRPRGKSRAGSGADYRSAVAFYPGCRRLRETAWSTRVPTLILIGASDDWTPASACQQMVSGARGRSARAKIVIYPGAHHDFDRPDSPVRLRTGLATVADGLGRAHVGTNPAARADAFKRVPEFVAR